MTKDWDDKMEMQHIKDTALVLSTEGKTRGVINNNPGNLRYTKTAWMGKVKDGRKKDDEFEEFISMWYGVRAAVINMRRISKRLGARDTVEKEIAIWAPHEDGNNPGAYYRIVKSRVEKVSPQWKDEGWTNATLKEKVAVMAAIFHVESMAKIDERTIELAIWTTKE